MAEKGTIPTVEISHSSASGIRATAQEPNPDYSDIEEDTDDTGKSSHAYIPPPKGNTRALAMQFDSQMQIVKPRKKPLCRSESAPLREKTEKNNPQPTEHEAQGESSSQRLYSTLKIKKGPRSSSLTNLPSHEEDVSQPIVQEVKKENASPLEAPQCLLYANEQGKLDCNADVLNQVAELEKMLVVVAVTGFYRTGKSYLLNRLSGSNSGFSLGNTIESNTKGVWIWVREHPLHPDRYLVLLDTEGLGDAKKGDEDHDKWLFCLATLLSSVLVYNAMTAINEDALSKLHIITDMSKHICTTADTKDSQSDEDFDFFFPAIIFVIRDFALRLERDGGEMTEDEYLADCLQLKPDNDEKSVSYNMSRRCIRRYFRRRKCFTFDRPADRSLLQNLDQLKESDLGKDFVRETKAFCDHVYKHGDVKRFATERPLNGRMWAVLVKNYVDAIKVGEQPCVMKALCAIGRGENQLAMGKALEFYVSRMETTALPTSDEKSLSEIHFQAHSAAIRRYLQEEMFEGENRTFEQLNELIHREYELVIARNNEASRAKCRQLLGILEREMLEKIKRDQYFKPGGLKEYGEDRQKIQSTYEGTNGLGPQAEAVLLEYSLEKTEQEKKIIEKDKALTGEQREKETKRQSVLTLEMVRQAGDGSESENQSIEYDKEKTHKLCMEELEIKNTKQKKARDSYVEKVTNDREAELKRLSMEGHAAEAERMEKAIRNVREAQKENKNCIIV